MQFGVHLFKLLFIQNSQRVGGFVIHDTRGPSSRSVLRCPLFKTVARSKTCRFLLYLTLKDTSKREFQVEQFGCCHGVIHNDSVPDCSLQPDDPTVWPRLSGAMHPQYVYPFLVSSATFPVSTVTSVTTVAAVGNSAYDRKY